jgi:tetratricopeptide (TPR) repeat protein
VTGRGLAIVVLAWLAGWCGAVAADDLADQSAFTAASQLLGAGDVVGARARFEAIAASDPHGRWADDALAEAAGIAERQGDLTAARRMWQAIVRDFPDGRVARRAQSRLVEMSAVGGVDGRWDAIAAEYERLQWSAAQAEDPHAALSAVATLLTDHRDFPPWFVAALWLGESWQRIGERDRAHRWLVLASAAARDPAERFRVQLAQAALLADRGDLIGARRMVAAAVPPDAIATTVQRDAIGQLDRRRLRHRLHLAAFAAMGAVLVIAGFALWRRPRSWRTAVRSLWPPPLEVVYLAPIAVVFAVVAETGNSIAARAVDHIVVGAIAITWLSGAVARAATERRRWWAVAAQVAVVTIAVIALAWTAVASDQLIELLLETWRNGHDLR